MPGFACGHAVAGFVPDQGSRTKPGGADRDRTVDLLNAIRRLVVDSVSRSGIEVDPALPFIESKAEHCFAVVGGDRL